MIFETANPLLLVLPEIFETDNPLLLIFLCFCFGFFFNIEKT